MPVLSGNDKVYQRTIVQDNDEYYTILEKVINILLTKEIKTFDIGFDYQYITLKKDIKVEQKMLPKHNDKSILVTSGNTLIELNPNSWEDIYIREDGTYEIETGNGRIYFKLLVKGNNRKT